MTGSSSYRLDELGWLQFDRLCSLVLEADAGLGGLQWRGRGDIARIARVDGPLVLRDGGHRLGGPVTVAAGCAGDLVEVTVTEIGTNTLFGTLADPSRTPQLATVGA